MSKKLLIEINLDWLHGDKNNTAMLLFQIAQQAVGGYPEDDLRYQTKSIDGDMVNLEVLGHEDEQRETIVYKACVVEGAIEDPVKPDREYVREDSTLRLNKEPDREQH